MSEQTREPSSDEAPPTAPDEAARSEVAGGGAPPPETRVSLAEFLAAERIADLEQLYRDRGATETGEDLLTVAQTDWHELTMWEALRTRGEPPERLEPLEVERDGVTYAIYGVIHGHVGGNDRDYKAFVDAALRDLPHTLFENSFAWFYPKRSHETIPDFAVAGFLGSLRMGLQVGLEFPVLILELVAELLKIKLPIGPQDAMLDYDARFHTLDPEVRRGVEPHPPLPSRLQIDYELQRWDGAGFWAGWKEPGAIVPRSMFMAGYAVGAAERRGEQRVSLVVGDLHTMEIVRFLREPRWAEHPVFRAGSDVARRARLARELWYWGAKLRHLSAAGLAGSAILLPVMFLLAWLLGLNELLMPWWSGGKL